jgi:hypothetical protein
MRPIVNQNNIERFVRLAHVELYVFIPLVAYGTANAVKMTINLKRIDIICNCSAKMSKINQYSRRNII